MEPTPDEPPPPAYSESFETPPPDYFTAVQLSEKIDLASGTIVTEAEEGKQKKRCCRVKTMITVYTVVGMIFVILLASGVLTGT